MTSLPPPPPPPPGERGDGAPPAPPPPPAAPAPTAPPPPAPPRRRDRAAGAGHSAPSDLVEQSGTLIAQRRRQLAGAIAVAAGVLLVLGGLLPWVSGPDADQVVTGVAVNADGVGVVGSRAGRAGGDALVIFLAGAAALGAGGFLLAGRVRAWQWRTLAVAAVGAAAWTWIDSREIGTVADLDGELLSLDPGTGVYVTAIGVVACVAAAILAPRRPPARAAVSMDLWVRLVQRGYDYDSLELSETSFRRARRSGDDRAATMALASVMSDQLWLGYPQAGGTNAGLAMVAVNELVEDDPAQGVTEGLFLAENFYRYDLEWGRSWGQHMVADWAPQLPDDERARLVDGLAEMDARVLAGLTPA